MSTDIARHDIVATVADRLGRDQVFGPPVERGGSTLLPVAHMRAGGGGGRDGGEESGGGAGITARPVGAFSISAKGKVRWHRRWTSTGSCSVGSSWSGRWLRWRCCCSTGAPGGDSETGRPCSGGRTVRAWHHPTRPLCCRTTGTDGAGASTLTGYDERWEQMAAAGHNPHGESS